VSIRRLVVACATVFAALMSASNADPCSRGIARVQAQFDAKLQANAAVGPSARESVAATMNRQPTPESIAAAEAKLGEIPPETVEAVEAGMARARDADRAGDESTCEQALADVQRILGQYTRYSTQRTRACLRARKMRHGSSLDCGCSGHR
jgi:hypothetical protein